MNIMVIVSKFKRSGPLLVIENIYKNVEGMKVDLVALNPYNDDKYKEHLATIGFSLIELNINKRETLFPKTKNIFGKIDITKYDIVHTHGIRPDYIVSRFKLKNHCTTIHNYPFEDYPMTYGKVKGLLMSHFHVSVMKKISHVIFCSDSIPKRLKYKNKNMHVIFNGVDIMRFENTYQKREENVKSFVSVGHLSYRKNPLEIIKVFNKISNDYPNKNMKLYLLGTGDLYQECAKYANKNIILTGKVNNVEEYLNLSDCYVSASLSEGTPNSVLEALSVGLPCIISDIPSHQSIANLINSVKIYQNEDELYNLMKDIIFGNEKVFQKNANFDLYFSSDSMSNKYLGLYKDIVQEKKL